MSSYSAFLDDQSDDRSRSFDERYGLQDRDSVYAPPLTPSVSTPSVHSLFTPPQVVLEDPDSAAPSLQALLQLAMQQHTPSPPPFKAPSEADYTAAAASLLSCLSVQPNVRREGKQSDQSPVNPVIQSLLNSPTQLTPRSISGKVMELATDRNGSRLLQKLLTQGGVEIVSRVIDEVEFSLPVIMCDTYANYMCQQLFQAASAGQRLRLLTRLAPRFVEVARDRRGTHSLQALISHVSTVMEEDVLAATLRGKVESVALDVHATHVLQQAISCCLSKPGGSEKALDFVFREVRDSIDRLAVDPNALGVVKRCITHSVARGFADDLAIGIERHLLEFVENPYANYAVQHALETWGSSQDALAERMIVRICEKIAPMALHKFASNVAEMAIKSSRPALRHKLIEALHYEEDARMLALMRSPFGVFVVGTAVKYACDRRQANAVTMAIVRNLRKLPEGRNKCKWEKLVRECALLNALTQIPLN